MQLVLETKLGKLYRADCLKLLKSLPDNSVHLFFADPPFNLGKDYGRNGNDKLSETEYLRWSEKWLKEAVRIVAPGGAVFLYNLPKWLVHYGSLLNSQPELLFKHWIAVYKAQGLPIPKRLSPAHYGLLYYIKGPTPRVFNRDAVRTRIQVCRSCGRTVKDYGGHKKFLNKKGLNLTDVWIDVPPVRHLKYKHSKANELAPIILERVIRLTTKKNDLVVDPFAGSGTTASVAEQLGRKWISGDLNSWATAKRRLLLNSADPGHASRLAATNGRPSLGAKAMPRRVACAV
jgi:site-specific DNA-methyltransferase (adenine-specific)